MIELFENEIHKNDWGSSKGDQLKWYSGEYWYKADSLGYEGLAEYVISHVLKSSTLKEDEYVLYDVETIKYKSRVINGCRSRNFLNEGESLITLERLYRNAYGRSFYTDIWSIEDHEDRLRYLVDKTTALTGIKDLGIYMSKILTVDTVFLNEYRHLHNIAVIRRPDGTYRTCPIFDCGAGLLSDTERDYPLGIDVYEAMQKDVRAKTFTEDFVEQLELVEKLYGSHIRFKIKRIEVEALVTEAAEYDEKIRNRVIDIICSRMSKLGYLFG